LRVPICPIPDHAVAHTCTALTLNLRSKNRARLSEMPNHGLLRGRMRRTCRRTSGRSEEGVFRAHAVPARWRFPHRPFTFLTAARPSHTPMSVSIKPVNLRHHDEDPPAPIPVALHSMVPSHLVSCQVTACASPRCRRMVFFLILLIIRRTVLLFDNPLKGR